jgi:hypothetical protein
MAGMRFEDVVIPATIYGALPPRDCGRSNLQERPCWKRRGLSVNGFALPVRGLRATSPPMPAYAYGFGDPCLPTRVTVAPSGPLWVHEIQGYRLMVRRTDSGVRIRTRRG